MTTIDPAKAEFPSLWLAGFHALTVDLVRERCVKSVPLSGTRARLMEAFETVLNRLEDAGLTGAVWLDGSFVTKKIDPSDIDFILVINSTVYDEATPDQRAVMDCLTDGCGWIPPECDTNVAYIDDTTRSNSASVLSYWQQRFGYSSDGLVPKGIVVLQVGIKAATDSAEGAAT